MSFFHWLQPTLDIVVHGVTLLHNYAVLQTISLKDSVSNGVENLDGDCFVWQAWDERFLVSSSVLQWYSCRISVMSRPRRCILSIKHHTTLLVIRYSSLNGNLFQQLRLRTAAITVRLGVTSCRILLRFIRGFVNFLFGCAARIVSRRDATKEAPLLNIFREDRSNLLLFTVFFRRGCSTFVLICISSPHWVLLHGSEPMALVDDTGHSTTQVIPDLVRCLLVDDNDLTIVRINPTTEPVALLELLLTVNVILLLPFTGDFVPVESFLLFFQIRLNGLVRICRIRRRIQ
mmetsp:Transcript_34839/g.84259  ORF Transcript_34839/g.84259 Transcript_34839/m.84259 type:complete len:289 (+) Transcript_34839:1885-2751(+)